MKKRIVSLFLPFILTSLFLDVFAFDGNGTITSSGISRSFVFHAPGASVAEDLPMVLIYHGDGGSGAGIKAYSGFDAISDTGGFIAVYLNADTDGAGWKRAINQTKDSQFTSDLIDYFCETYHIDAKRVYATGHSAGGFMVYNLAVNLPNKIAAFAPVAGNMYASNADYSYFSSSNFKPVPIFHIHGDPDNTVAYPDPDHSPTAWSEWPLTQFSYYACNKTTYTLPNTALATHVSKLTFCSENASVAKEIALVRVEGVGHGWPTVTGFNPAQAIWDFVNSYSLPAAQSCSRIVEEPTHAEGTIHVQGKHILSPCNQIFVPRGVNYSLADDWEFPDNMNGDPTNVNNELSSEIIKANPNMVRIQWYVNRQAGWKPYAVSDLEQVVTRFENAGIVSVIEAHDFTCTNDYNGFNSTLLPWWTQASVKSLINAHRGFVIVNLANEFGTVKWASDQQTAYTTWVNHYKAAIISIRNAGIEVPIMIDAPDCGQNLDIVLQAGAALLSHDPLKNMIMSVHAYWYADDANTIEAKALQISNASFPIVIGEIANIQDATGPCSNNITSYTNLLQSCQNYQIGWMAWTWTDDWCANRRIASNGSFTNLTSYGQTIVNNPNFGLASTANKMNISCLTDPLPVRLVDFNLGREADSHVVLTWKTTFEHGFMGFEIEKSLDAKQFSRLGFVAAAGATNGDSYLFVDTKAFDKLAYYRLKILNLDGSYSYSILKSITNSEIQTIIFPSPTSKYFQVRSSHFKLPQTIYLTEPSGIIVMKEVIVDSSQKINIDHLPEGIYIVSNEEGVIGKIFVSH